MPVFAYRISEIEHFEDICIKHRHKLEYDRCDIRKTVASFPVLVAEWPHGRKHDQPDSPAYVSQPASQPAVQ